MKYIEVGLFSCIIIDRLFLSLTASIFCYVDIINDVQRCFFLVVVTDGKKF